MATLGVALLDAAMPALVRRAAEIGWQRTTERDFQRAVNDATGAGSAAVRLDRWPAVGRVDLMLPGRVAVELKWSRGDKTLANCAWDAAKLATALAEGTIAEGYLAAGAPRDHWRTARDGVELFGDRVTFAGDAIVRRYESWWRFWCKDVLTRPIELPTALAVTCVAETTSRLQNRPWSLRLALVEVVGRDVASTRLPTRMAWRARPTRRASSRLSPTTRRPAAACRCRARARRTRCPSRTRG